MKKYLLTFSALLLACFTYAQQAPHSFPTLEHRPVWKVLFSKLCLDCVAKSTHSISYTGDTTICGKRYYKLASYKNYYSLGKSVNAYIRVDLKKVYVRPDWVSCSDGDFVIYDFGLKTGDSIQCAFNVGYEDFFSQKTIRILKTDSVQVLDTMRLRLTTSLFYDGRGSLTWIEGVGNPVDPFYAFAGYHFQGDRIFKSSEFYESLRCLDIDSVPGARVPIYRVRNNPMLSCDTSFFLLGLAESKIASKWNLTISEDKSSLTIDGPKGIASLQVVTIAGQNLYSSHQASNNEQSLKVELAQALNAGVFIVVIGDSSGNKEVLKVLVL